MAPPGSSPHQPPSRDSKTKRAIPALVLAVLYLCLAVPGIALQLTRPIEAPPGSPPGTPPPSTIVEWGEQGQPNISEWADAELYHLPLIRVMAEQWPAVDIARYDSATAPGYHLLMAGVLSTTGSTVAMLILNALLGAALVFAVARTAGSLSHPVIGALAALPLALNQYVLAGGMFLTTDNLALLLIAITLGVVLMERPTAPRLAIAGVAAGLAVFTRQLHVWLGAPLVLLAVCLTPLIRLVPTPLRLAEGERPTTAQRLIAVLAAIAPFAVLGVLFTLWGGLLPILPEGSISALHSGGPNPAGFALTLSLVAAFAVPFVPAFREPIVRFLKAPLRDPIAIAAIVVALLIALAFATSETYQLRAQGIEDPAIWKARTYGWVWRLVRIAPTVADRSLLLTLGAPIGALALVILVRSARDAGKGALAGVLVLTLLGWLLAQSMNAMAWLRYFEPTVLIGFAWLLLLGWNAHPATTRGRIALGFIILAAMQLAITGIGLALDILRAL